MSFTIPKALRSLFRRKRRLLGRISRTAPDAIPVTALDGRLVMTNEQAARLHGCESVDALLNSGKNAFEWIAPEDRERALINAQKTLEEGQIRQIEYTLLREDGTQIGPVVSAEQLAGNLDYVALGKSEAADLLSGGERLERPTEGYYMAPAVFAATRNDMRINR